jgi:hypothetical protein
MRLSGTSMLIVQSGSVLFREHAAHNVLVDVDAEEMGDLLGDAHTAATAYLWRLRFLHALLK